MEDDTSKEVHDCTATLVIEREACELYAETNPEDKKVVNVFCAVELELREVKPISCK